MAKPKHKNVPKSKANVPPKAEKANMLDRWEQKLVKNQKVILYSILGISFLFSLLLFDVKISPANDDALYIQGGYNLAKDINHSFTANAPLYPLVLSVPIKFFGINLILLKFLSVIFTQLHILFLFLAFRKRAPYVILIPVMFLVATNAYFQYFASQTFTEAFFLFIQAVFVYFISENYESITSTTSLKQTWRKWVLIGLFAFLLSIAKNLALLAIVTLILFFILDRKFLQAVYALGSFLIFSIPYQLLASSLTEGKSQYTSQSSIIMQVDPYNASKGMETFGGFVGRFFRNGALYLSRRFFQILGFQADDSTKVNGAVSVFLVLIFLVALFFIIRNKNKILLFVSIYTAAMAGATFTALQVQWDQPRFVLVYVPFILLAIFCGWYYMFRKNSIGQFFLAVSMFIMVSAGVFATLKKAGSNFNILQRNLSGDIYYGYSPDWVNYLKMSVYCGDSLPANALVGVRKAPMSFIYAKGKDFYPIFTAFSDNADTILTNFKENNVTHILMANLRRNPKRNDSYIINTIQRLLYPIMQKYPQKLEMVKQIGESEPAYLYKINYDK